VIALLLIMSIKVAIQPTYALLDCSILGIPECGPVYSNQKGAFCYECGMITAHGQSCSMADQYQMLKYATVFIM
jgi:hypothetical protein